MNRHLTDEQAAYLSQLYTGTDAPKLRRIKELEDAVCNLRAANERIACKCAKWWNKADERGKTIQRLERAARDRNRRIDELEDQVNYLYGKLDRRLGELVKALMIARERGETIHRLERRLSRANRRYAALHRAMHEDTKTASVALHASVERFGEALANAGNMLHRHYPSVVECSAYGAAWPRFEDGKPVEVGDTVKGVMVDVTVASIVFRADCVVLYDSQMFHYVKLDGGERAQRPDGTRLPLD